MAHKVEFIKADKVNSKEYKKGEVINVSSSIYATLISNGTVKDFTKKTFESQKKED